MLSHYVFKAFRAMGKKRSIARSLKIALFLTLILSPSSTSAQIIHADFERVVKEMGKSESVEGELYFLSPVRIFVKVRSPVKQILYLQRDILTIYYPEEKKGFRMRSKNFFQVPFASSLANIRIESVLSQAGYKKAKEKKRGDEVREVWKPGKKGITGEITLKRSKGVLRTLEVELKGIGKFTTSYEDYVAVGDRKIPRRIHIVSEVKGRRSEEEIRFSMLEVLERVPPEIEGFRIPPGAKVEEIEF